MKSPEACGVSRRAFFTALAVGGAAVCLAGTIGCRRDPAPAPPSASLPYADHDGWMLKPAEKRALVPRGPTESH